MATETQARELLEGWAAGWSSGDVERAVELFVDDCVYEDVPLGVVNRGKDELRAFGAGFLAAVPDFAVRLMHVVSAGDKAGVEWVMRGTQTGDLPDMPASHRTFEVRGASMFELRGDRLATCRDYWDMATFLRQLGFIS
jgi:steroid delta-isomerase-like uncharacterized protein